MCAVAVVQWGGLTGLLELLALAGTCVSRLTPRRPIVPGCTHAQFSVHGSGGIALCDAVNIVACRDDALGPVSSARVFRRRPHQKGTVHARVDRVGPLTTTHPGASSLLCRSNRAFPPSHHRCPPAVHFSSQPTPPVACLLACPPVCVSGHPGQPGLGCCVACPPACLPLSKPARSPGMVLARPCHLGVHNHHPPCHAPARPPPFLPAISSTSSC